MGGSGAEGHVRPSAGLSIHGCVGFEIDGAGQVPSAAGGEPSGQFDSMLELLFLADEVGGGDGDVALRVGEVGDVALRVGEVGVIVVWFAAVVGVIVDARKREPGTPC